MDGKKQFMLPKGSFLVSKAYLNKYILYIQKWLCFEKWMTTMTKKKIFEDDEYFQ